MTRAHPQTRTVTHPHPHARHTVTHVNTTSGQRFSRFVYLFDILLYTYYYYQRFMYNIITIITIIIMCCWHGFITVVDTRHVRESTERRHSLARPRRIWMLRNRASSIIQVQVRCFVHVLVHRVTPLSTDCSDCTDVQRQAAKTRDHQ